MKETIDIVIIGAGPAGCAAAMILQNNTNLKVLVIDRGPSVTHIAGESIPPDSRLLFQQLGIWQEFLNQGHDKCLGNSSSWGHSDLGYSDFIYNPMGHGWHLQRQKFNDFMLRQITDTTIDLRLNTKFVNCQTRDQQYQLTLQDSDKKQYLVTCNFVIDATGTRSSFARKQASIKTLNDDLACITGFFNNQSDGSFNELTLLEAVEYGWWYSAKLPNNRLAVALACDKSFCKHFKINKLENWYQLFKQHSSHIYPKMKNYEFISDSLLVNATPSFILDKISNSNWLAIGDAASAYDPISAQGIYKAMANGITAAKAILENISGNPQAIKNYDAIVRLDYDNYIANKNYLYSQENRWPKSPFWKNRKSSIREATG
jgi:flavin-dependent dehydrogenase